MIKNKLYEVEEISPSFVRINKSNVVNVLAVDKISPSLNSHLTLWLTDGQDLEVSRKYKKNIFELSGGKMKIIKAFGWVVVLGALFNLYFSLINGSIGDVVSFVVFFGLRFIRISIN